MVQENTNGQMVENSQVIGCAIKCMVRVYSLGLTEEDMKETTMMIKSKDMVFSYGLMVDNMMEPG